MQSGWFGSNIGPRDLLYACLLAINRVFPEQMQEVMQKHQQNAQPNEILYLLEYALQSWKWQVNDRIQILSSDARIYKHHYYRLQGEVENLQESALYKELEQARERISSLESSLEKKKLSYLSLQESLITERTQWMASDQELKETIEELNRIIAQQEEQLRRLLGDDDISAHNS